MANGLFDNVYNPDVLSCLANLSNDEVFTPPEIVNQMLDMLPQELFRNPDTTFLDPACKTGVFLREIAKRLIDGLEPQFPDLQQRLDHIFHKQLYGIAITELTSLLSRRGLYCSKYPNSEFSVSHFDDAQGNIRFKRIRHTWDTNREVRDLDGKKIGKCIYCGASRSEYDRTDDLETHAYEWIHTHNPEEIFNMKFDVIIGNPPYQLSDGGAGASAKPIYNLFVEQAKKLKPRYLSMIIPSRWMAGGKGLDQFRDAMINDRHITVLHDFIDSQDCFSGVDVKGGICYFLIDTYTEAPCKITTHMANGNQCSERYLREEGIDVYIRQAELISIKDKVLSVTKKSFSSVVSSRKPYGLPSDFFKSTYKYNLPGLSEIPKEKGIAIIGLHNLKRAWRYAGKDYPLPKRDGLNQWKIFIPNAYGCGAIGEVPSTPVLGTPGQACTETFLQLGPWNTKEEAENALKYLSTKFFRCMVGIIKQTQHTSTSTYRLVPMEDFTSNNKDIDWGCSVSDIGYQLYKKYGLTEEEIEFIEENIEPMDLEV